MKFGEPRPYIRHVCAFHCRDEKVHRATAGSSAAFPGVQRLPWWRVGVRGESRGGEGWDWQGGGRKGRKEREGRNRAEMPKGQRLGWDRRCSEWDNLGR